MYPEYQYLVKKAIQYIEAHLLEKMKSEDVATYVGMSKYHFHRIFVSFIGCSITDYIRQRRLTYAAGDLLYTDLRVLDIALQYHFSSQESFTRSFQQMFNMPPRRYRTYYSNFLTIREEQVMNTLLPKGWAIGGIHLSQYEIGVSQEVVHQGQRSGQIIGYEHAQLDGFGTLMQIFRADRYHQQRLRLSAFISTEEVKQFAGLWMRVDDAQEQVLQFDNMNNRPIQGTTGWNPYSVVLDIPEEADTISIGLILNGPGKVWIDNIRLEQVDFKVPNTHIEEEEPTVLPDEPVNLDFELQDTPTEK